MCWLYRQVSALVCREFCLCSSLVQYGFHFGGDSGEFEDTQGFHPWKELIDGRLAYNEVDSVCGLSFSSVFPTTTKWKGLKWDQAKHVETLRNEGMNITRKRVRELLEPHRYALFTIWLLIFSARLEQYPLYITLDKDCMQRKDNLQNWNSGSLSRDEVRFVCTVLVCWLLGDHYYRDLARVFEESTGRDGYHWRFYQGERVWSLPPLPTRDTTRRGQ